MQDMELAARGCGPPPAGLSTWVSALRIGRVDEERNDGRRGHQLVQQLQPLRPQLHVQVVTPVRLPPGRFRLATSPASTGSAPVRKTIGIVAVAALAASAAGVRRSRRSRSPGDEPDRRPMPAVDRTGRPPSDIRSPRCGPRHSRLRSDLGGTRARRCAVGRRRGAEKPDHRHRRLLRARGERPAAAAPPKKRDEFAPSHSITSSARASSDGGMSRPSILAVWALMTSSNLVAARPAGPPAWRP